MYARGLGANQPNSFSFTKLSGPTPYPNFQVGDSWSIVITGPANAPIFVSSTQNGVAQPAQQFGTTDANGSFSFNGTMLEAAIGSWVENWFIGTSAGPGDPTRTPLSTVTFSVAAPAPSNQNQNTQPPVTNPAFVNTVVDSSGLQIAGYDIPWWAVAGVGAGLLFMLSGRRR